MQLDKIPRRIISDIEELMVENGRYGVKTAEEARAQMDQYTAKELFDMYLVWNGIQGYTESIVLALDSIRAAKEAK